MDDKFEKKLKEFLPYIIILGITFLVLPMSLRFFGNSLIINNIFLMGVLPLSTLLCNLFYTYKKKTDYLMLLIGPIFFVPAMFLYGIFADSAINSLIFLLAYVISGYIGMVIGEMLKGKDSTDQEEGYTRNKRNVPETISNIQNQIDEEDDFEDIEMPQKFEQDVAQSQPQDTDEYDLDAILNEIQNRRDS